MDLSQLRTFHAIAKEGNLTRASHLLFLSQPAVSAQIKQLEDELGLKLFERNSRGMTLTNAGKILLDDASSILEAADKIVLNAKNLKGNLDGRIRIGTISEPVVLRLSETLLLLNRTYPKIRITLTQGISGDIITLLKNKSIDIGYIIGAVQDENISSFKVKSINLCIVAPKDWEEEIRNATWDDISNLPWVMTPERCSFNAIAKRIFRENAIDPHILIESDQEVALAKFVASGVGLTILREDVALAAEKNNELFVWKKLTEASDLNVAYLRTSHQDPIVSTIIKVLKQVWHAE